MRTWKRPPRDRGLKHGSFTWHPIGLRDAVLHAVYAHPLPNRHKPYHPGIEDDVRRWQRGEGCTPEQWQALVAAVLATSKEPMVITKAVA